MWLVFSFRTYCSIHSKTTLRPNEYGHRLELPFHLVDQNREVFTRKSNFLVIFVLVGDLI